MVKTPLLSTDLVKRVPFPQCSVDLRCTSGRFAKNTTPFFAGRGDIGSGAAGGSAENAPGTALAWSGSSDHRLVVGSLCREKSGLSGRRVGNRRGRVGSTVRFHAGPG